MDKPILARAKKYKSWMINRFVDFGSESGPGSSDHRKLLTFKVGVEFITHILPALLKCASAPRPPAATQSAPPKQERKERAQESSGRDLLDYEENGNDDDDDDDNTLSSGNLGDNEFVF